MLALPEPLGIAQCFSNAAFYSRKLLTVPDVTQDAVKALIEVCRRKPATLTSPSSLIASASFIICLQWYVRGSSKPACEAGSYRAVGARNFEDEKQARAWALWHSLEAQQSEIESALNTLASQDSEFDESLQAEFTREEDEQFCGLFVKNLENVQGDDGDMIIMACAMGTDAQRKC